MPLELKKNFYSPKEIYLSLEIPQSSFYDNLRLGKIPGTQRIGGRYRITREGLERFLQDIEYSDIPEYFEG